MTYSLKYLTFCQKQITKSNEKISNYLISLFFQYLLSEAKGIWSHKNVGSVLSRELEGSTSPKITFKKRLVIRNNNKCLKCDLWPLLINRTSIWMQHITKGITKGLLVPGGGGRSQLKKLRNRGHGEADFFGVIHVCILALTWN